MNEQPVPADQFGKGGDATRDGGASADRGGRDIGTPGPDPDELVPRDGGPPETAETPTGNDPARTASRHLQTHEPTEPS